jgi:hypothetical protein
LFRLHVESIITHGPKAFAHVRSTGGNVSKDEGNRFEGR